MKRWCDKNVPRAKKTKNMCAFFVFQVLWIIFHTKCRFLLTMILFPVGPKCWHDWGQKWWKYLYCKYHFRANNRCDENVPCMVSDQLIQGLHCSCLTPAVVVQTVCRKTMISASIQHMLHLGCIIQWFWHLDLPFESSEVSQNQRSSKHNWAGVRGEHCGYYGWRWSSAPLL